MKMYRIFNYEKDVLERQTMSGGCKYAPFKDKNGDYFISEVEYKQCGLGVEAEFIPPPPPEEML
jgi:hypothetical protein